MNQMKFAAPYEIACPINYDNIDEFNIVFTENSSFDELETFVQSYPEHRINIKFSEEQYDISNIILFCHNYNNVYVQMRFWELEYLDIFEEEDINFFFDKSMPIYNYLLLEWALSHKTKGIYIADDLTYNIVNIHEQCIERGIELRIVLNKIPVTNKLVLSCPTVQMYRPQDYDFLDKYYAVGEFDYDQKYDWNKTKILYRHWFIDHKWTEDLEYINEDVELPYPTQSIPFELARLRSMCQHRCTMRAANICSKCSRLLLMSYWNADNGIRYVVPEQSLPPLEKMVDTILISKDNNIN